MLNGIRQAEKKDIPELCKIWETCFGDPIEYIEYFYRENFERITGLVYVVDGRIVSAAHLMPALFVNGSRKHDAMLGYAGGTLPRYRHSGYFKKVMQEMLRRSDEEGFVFFFKPSKPEQFEYYNRFGCKKDACFKIVTIKAGENVPAGYGADAEGEKVRFRPVFAGEYNRLRNKAFSGHPYVRWSDDHVGWSINENEFCGGRTIAIETDDKTHFLMGVPEKYTDENDSTKSSKGTLKIIETDLSVCELRKYSGKLCGFFGTKDIKAYLPDHSCDEGDELVSSFIYNAPLNNTYANLILI